MVGRGFEKWTPIACSGPTKHARYHSAQLLKLNTNGSTQFSAHQTQKRDRRARQQSFIISGFHGKGWRCRLQKLPRHRGQGWRPPEWNEYIPKKNRHSESVRSGRPGGAVTRGTRARPTAAAGRCPQKIPNLPTEKGSWLALIMCYNKGLGVQTPA